MSTCRTIKSQNASQQINKTLKIAQNDYRENVHQGAFHSLICAPLVADSVATEDTVWRHNGPEVARRRVSYDVTIPATDTTEVRPGGSRGATELHVSGLCLLQRPPRANGTDPK